VGIGGVLAVEVVGEIEVDVAPRVSQDETFVLAHCLDYIATPRTGAIVAAGLARPTRIDEMRSMRATHGAQLFDKASIISRFTYKYDSSRLEELLKSTFDADASRSVALR
jgi:hypothetical protein